MKNLRLFLLSFVKTMILNVEDFITLDDNLTTSTGQINTNMIDWRQQAREDAIQEVSLDVSSNIQSEVISGDDDDNEEEEENIPRQLSTIQALTNLDELINVLLNQNNETLTTLITEAIETVD